MKRIRDSLYRIHRQCKHCREITNEFLSIKGEPIIGECVYNDKRFLLNDKTDCSEYK